MRIVPAPVTATLRVPRRSAFIQVLKTAVAVDLAWVIAGLTVHVEVPIFGAQDRAKVGNDGSSAELSWPSKCVLCE